MSLDITFTETRPVEVFEGNITHNCAAMATALGVYGVLWGGHQVTLAEDLIKPVKLAIKRLEDDPAYYKPYEPENGWGTRAQFLEFLYKVLISAQAYPKAIVDQYK